MRRYAPRMAIAFARLERPWQRGVRSLFWPAALVLCLLLLSAPAEADWLARLVGTAREISLPGPRRSSSALDAVAAHIKTLTAKADGAVLAAQATAEGHWRFVNGLGETITAGTPEEMKRVGSLLLPNAKPEPRLSLHLTADSVFARRAALKDLPRGSELYVFAGEESYRLLRRSEAAGERLFAEIRSNLVVELTEETQFAETVWQLARPLNKAGIRILALEPGAAPRLASSPRLDPASKAALIDSIDPLSLPAALGTLRGQTVLVTGRIDGQLLYFKPGSGPDRSLTVSDLFRAAEAADVNVIVLHATSTPRQPGGRNWLWQKVEVQGLEEALKRARVADFYNALAPAGGRFTVSAKPAGAQRTSLEIAPIGELPKAPGSRPIGDLWTDAVAGVTGRVITAGVEANIRSAALQQDVDWRLLSSVPAKVQIGYLALLVIGLLGTPLARLWWANLWPQETAADYAGPAGYWAARAVRNALFVAVFLPLTAPLSAPLNLGRQIWEALRVPIRCCRWLMQKLRRRRPDTAAAHGRGVGAGTTPIGLGPASPHGEAPRLGSYRPSR